MKTDEMTLEQRLEAKDLVPLSKEFVATISHTAKLNNLSANQIWQKWQNYQKQCESFDQSPSLPEFFAWNKLKTGKIEYPDGTWTYVGGTC